MIQWKFTFDKDEEQDWLNDYCREGWAMAGFFAGLVMFVPCRPGEFIYQIDLLPGAGLRLRGLCVLYARHGRGGAPAVGPVGVPAQAG